MIQDIARRTDDSKLTDWYFGIDRKLLVAIIVTMCVGVIATVSTGSAMAIRKGWNWYHFFIGMLPFYIVGLFTLFGSSMLNKKSITILSWINVVICFVLVAVTVFQNNVVNGSSRWVVIFGHSLMPSDIMKPGFVIITAWFLTKMKELYGDDIFQNKAAWRFKMLSWWPYVIAFLLFLGMLVKQPDIGTSIVYSSVLMVMLIVAGLPMKLFAGLCSLFCAGFVGAFLFVPHVHNRIMDFLFVPLDPKSQIGYSVNSIRQGGLFGMADEAFAAEKLPMAESDFVYATLAEDFGAICACVLVYILFYIISRLVHDAIDARDRFVFYAVSGAAGLFAVQVALNLATTLHLMPPKGMTLPFVSFGGSSFLGFCLLFGVILAIIREDKWK